MPGEEEKTDEKPLFEKLIFNGTWVRHSPLATPFSHCRLATLLAGRASSPAGTEARPGALACRRDPSLTRWQAGILTLVLIEIFINTPAFQAIKPAILSFLGSD